MVSSEDASEDLVREIRRKMDVTSAEAQPLAGVVLLVFILFFGVFPPLGFHRQTPPHAAEGIFLVPVFLIALKRGEAKKGAVTPFHCGCQRPVPPPARWDADRKTDSVEGV